MPKAIITYVRYIEAANRTIGRFAMYLIFAILGVLLYSSFMKTFFLPVLWTLEVAQFLMVAYYLLGGAYSMQMESHVRMDILYSRFSPKKKGFTDSLTSFFLITYLAFFLYGGFSSTEYALKYGEKSYSSWAPYMAPVKITMTFGILMMILQAFATFFKDLARAKGLSLFEQGPANGASS